MKFSCRSLRAWRCPRRQRLIIILLLCAAISLIICWSYPRTKQKFKDSINIPNVVWWNIMRNQNYDSVRFCGFYACRFSNNRANFKDAKAILMYGSHLEAHDFPLPRQSHQLWGLLHEESPRNKPFISNLALLQHFNVTSTYSRYSDLPITTHYLPDTSELTAQTYMKTMYERSFVENAQVIFLQSDCDTPSRREDYVRELMQYTAIDSYGSCLHNRDLPQSLQHDYLNNLYSPDLLRFISTYKFVLAIENGVCNDYITEKFWRPLITGSIPIYFGSPTIREWAPNNKSVIYVDDFESPEMLAKFINKLSQNDTEFTTYLDHKFNQVTPIKNQRLQNDLLRRPYATSSGINVYGTFECHVCKVIHELKLGEIKQANLDHYNCPLPPPHPSMKTKKYMGLDWESIMRFGQCQAQTLNDLFKINLPFNKNMFDTALNARINKGSYKNSLTCD